MSTTAERSKTTILKSEIPFSTIGFNPLTIDYLQGKATLDPFYKRKAALSSIKEQIAARNAKPVDRQVLVKALKEQYTKLAIPYSAAVSANIEALNANNTFTVTTGHQLSIFTGPLYFVYKILSAVKLADTLNSEFPEYRFVPVYWMASEDHDFEEISSINLFNKTLTWEQSLGGATGKIPTQSLAPFITELNELLGSTEHAEELKNIFAKAYQSHTNLADATRALTEQLFGSYGLVSIDGDHPAMKEQFMKVMQDDIHSQRAFSLVNESISALESQHYKAQVHPREINLFQLGEHSRERIVDPAATQGLKAEELSPNVVLRPLYEETILPNLAYIGGPAEVAYWLQYKSTFSHYDIPMPLLMLRNCFLWIDKSASDKLAKLGLSTEEIFLELSMLEKLIVSRLETDSLDLSDARHNLEAIYAAIAEQARTADPTLVATVEAEHQKTLAGLKNLEGRIMKASKAKHETTLQQARKLKEKLFPKGGLQERHDNFIPYYLQQGKSFFDHILKNAEAFPKGFSVLKEE